MQPLRCLFFILEIKRCHQLDLMAFGPRRQRPHESNVPRKGQAPKAANFEGNKGRFH